MTVNKIVGVQANYAIVDELPNTKQERIRLADCCNILAALAIGQQMSYGSFQPLDVHPNDNWRGRGKRKKVRT